jgi:hypothetical protein
MSCHLARWWGYSELLCLLLEKQLHALGTVALQLSDGLHCPLILVLLEFHFLHNGVQFLGECSGKFHLLLELEVPWIGYRLHMDAGRSMSHPVLRPNRMLIVYVPRNQVYTHTVHKMGTE